MRPLILITNDDGISAPGIQKLIELIAQVKNVKLSGSGFSSWIRVPGHVLQKGSMNAFSALFSQGTRLPRHSFCRCGNGRSFCALSSFDWSRRREIR